MKSLVILDVKSKDLQRHFLRSAQGRPWISADMEMKLCINCILPTYQAYLKSLGMYIFFTFLKCYSKIGIKKLK